MAKITINTESLTSGRDWVRHKIQDGSNVYRILPPFGDVEVHNNYPFRRWVVAWLIDPKLQKRMPFASPFSAGGEACPVHEYSKAIRDKIDARKAELKAAGVSDAKIKEELAGLNSVAWDIKLQKSFAYNACDKAGKIGLLEVKKTAHDDIKAKMMEYIKKFQMDPTSLNHDIKEDAGIWFNIKKSGSGKDTTYSADFNKKASKDEDGDTVYKNDRSALPENFEEAYQNEGYDLSKIYRQKTYEELFEILLYNIALIADEVPEAANIPGFNVGGTVEPLKKVVEEEPVAKPTKKVALALDDEDDDLDAAPAPKTQAKVSSHEDTLALAESILGE